MCSGLRQKSLRLAALRVPQLERDREHIIVFERLNPADRKAGEPEVLACATLVVEHKFIHGGRCVGTGAESEVGHVSATAELLLLLGAPLPVRHARPGATPRGAVSILAVLLSRPRRGRRGRFEHPRHRTRQDDGRSIPAATLLGAAPCRLGLHYPRSAACAGRWRLRPLARPHQGLYPGRRCGKEHRILREVRLRGQGGLDGQVPRPLDQVRRPLDHGLLCGSTEAHAAHAAFRQPTLDRAVLTHFFLKERLERQGQQGYLCATGTSTN
eukprot:scaffold10960_cov66-Phaeocystis_antarctica.AAC.1